MYFRRTLKKFFDSDPRYESYVLIIGLVYIFSFALINMPDWYWLTVSTVGLLASNILRFIITDESYYDEFKNLDDTSSIIDYIIGKNLFTILFTSLIMCIVFAILTMLTRLNYINIIPINLNILIIQNLFVLGTENILLIFFNRSVKSYKSSFKRNMDEDISTGIDNYKSLIPTLISNMCFTVLCFYFKANISIYIGIIYYIVCVSMFISYKKSKLMNN